MKFYLKSFCVSLFFSTPLLAFAEHGDKCSTSGGCAMKAVGIGIAWWLISSLLLLLSWNKVVVTLANVKMAKFWQALLVVATIGAFCAPKYMTHSKRCKMAESHKCNHHGEPSAETAEETK